MDKKAAFHKEEQRQAELEAMRRVVPWAGLRVEDYHFQWARTKDKGLLRAGCVYENARESWKLRCLLVLVDAALEKVEGMGFLGLDFEGLRYYDVLLRLGGWFGWLRSFTQELADNTPFADLGEKLVKESLERLPRYFLAPKAVGLAMPSGLIEPCVLWPWQMPGVDARGRGRENEPGIRLEIRFRDFTDKDIAAAMKELAGSLCGQEGPQRKGTGKGVSIRSRLDCLSTMRLASHYPKTLPLPRLLPRRDRRNRPHGTGTAVSKFNDIRLGGILPGSTKRKILGEVGHNEFDRYAARGRQQFLSMFPFGESAANSLSWAHRHAG